MGYSWGQVNYIYNKTLVLVPSCVIRKSVGCNGATGLLWLTFKDGIQNMYDNFYK